MDYMTYAYLQTGQDHAVQELMKTLADVNKRLDINAVGSAAPGSAGIFATAAIPVRWALEHRDWPAAAKLEAASTPFPYAEAMTHFARALGAAHTGALVPARASIDALQQIHDRLAQAGEAYWAEQVEIEREGASAFVALAEGKTDEAVRTMRGAAAREDATEKNAVTPGPVAPARELLGDLLIELKQPAAALCEYQATLEKEPNRFRAVYGAARAAALAGDQQTAKTMYAKLLSVCVKADQPGRPELAEARTATMGR
jgi:tetratricopeptide (TPR) repeat protein